MNYNLTPYDFEDRYQVLQIDLFLKILEKIGKNLNQEKQIKNLISIFFGKIKELKKLDISSIFEFLYTLVKYCTNL